MNDQTPFSRRGGGQSRPLSIWSLGVGEAEGERLQRYCDSMNARDPLRHFWFVAKAGDRMSVETQDRADPRSSPRRGHGAKQKAWRVVKR